MAAARQTATQMSVEDFLALPDDEYRYDLIEGELQRMPPVSGEHGRVELCLAFWLMSFVYRHRVGKVYGADVAFILSRAQRTVLCPDLAFIRTERVPVPDTGFLELAPDLAVEVVSPSNSEAELTRKTNLYLRAGTSLVWVVDPPRRQITVHATG